MTTLLACSAFARDHSSLNGVWRLVPAKSDFAGQPVVQTGTVTINDREGVITVSRSFKYEGATETFFYSDITDELGRFEAAAGTFLEELSYPKGVEQPRKDHLAEATRIRGLFDEVAATPVMK